MKEPSGPVRTLFQAHGRSFRRNLYVYPVLSRRSGGISVGVNLNRDKNCNFHCIYCQVDRTGPCQEEPIDLGCLRDELAGMIDLVISGRIFEEGTFRDTPQSLRRLKDVALSGDGEPTACSRFDDVVAACDEVCRQRELREVKLVLITNASLLHQPTVRRGLEILDAAGGEIWAKLDAGTEPYFRKVARSAVPFRRILDNLAEAARARPIVIQSMMTRIHGRPPSPAEQAAYCDRLCETAAGGGRIKLVQIYTVARPPAEEWVAALSAAEVDAIAELVRRRTGLPVAAFPG